jgi:hypothetical protein
MRRKGLDERSFLLRRVEISASVTASITAAGDQPKST